MLKRRKGDVHLGLEYEEDKPTVNRKRVREGLEQCKDEIMTSTAILLKRIQDALDWIAEEEEDEVFVVDDEGEDEISNSNADWVSDADAEHMLSLLLMLERAGATISFTDLLGTESYAQRQWWQRVFQDRLDGVIRGFGKDDGKRAQLIALAIRDNVLAQRSVTLAPSKNNNNKCCMCGLARNADHTLKIHKSSHAVGRHCAKVVQALINFWEFLGTYVTTENGLEEGRQAYWQLLGCLQAVEQAHEDKSL